MADDFISIPGRIYIDEKHMDRQLKNIGKQIQRAFNKKIMPDFSKTKNLDLGGTEKEIMKNLGSINAVLAKTLIRMEKFERERAMMVDSFYRKSEKTTAEMYKRELNHNKRIQANRIRSLMQSMVQGSYKSKDYMPGSPEHKTAIKAESAFSSYQRNKSGPIKKLHYFMSQIRGQSQEEASKGQQQAHKADRSARGPALKGMKGLMGMVSKVKLVGGIAGIAGAAGLGKMIIDSSPMLQAMMKIISTGFTFILRPIGDMFGLLIRPVAIIFLKYAVGFYKSTLKYFPAWNKWGGAIAAFFTGRFEESGNLFNAGSAEFYKANAIDDMLKKFTGADSEGGKKITKGEAMLLSLERQKWDEVIALLLEGVPPHEVWDVWKSGKRAGGVDVGPSSEPDLSHLFNPPGTSGAVGLPELTWWERLAGAGAYLQEKLLGSRDALGTFYDWLKKFGVMQFIGPRGPGPTSTTNAQGGQDFNVPLEETLTFSGDMKAKNTTWKKNQQLQEKWMKQQQDVFKLFDVFAQGLKAVNTSGGNFAKPEFETGGYMKINPATGVPYTSAERKGDMDKTGSQAGEFGYVGNLSDKSKQVYSNYLQYKGASPEQVQESIYGSTDNSEEVNKAEKVLENWEAIEGFMDQAENMGLNITEETRGVWDSAKKSHAAWKKTGTYSEQTMTVMANTYDKIITALNKLRSFKTGSGKTPFKNQANAALGELGAETDPTVETPETQEHGIVFHDKPRNYPDRQEMERHPGWTLGTHEKQIKKIRDEKGWSWSSYAHGGIINEPVFGMGQRTGKGYKFGEAGPEMVTPLSGGGGVGGNTNITINVSGVTDTRSFERDIVPVIKRVLKESTARRGIL